jgi:hypothetical protein
MPHKPRSLSRNLATLPAAEPESPAPHFPKIRPSDARYIKLGAGGRLAQDCIAHGAIRLGFDGVSHAACRAGDWEAVRRSLHKPGKAPGAATNQAQQIEDFYTLGADTLWITFWSGKLWWAFAEPGVVCDPSQDYLTRHRRAIGPWRCTDIAGHELKTAAFSTKLTQLAAFRGTLCKVKQLDYLVRRINGKAEPLVAEAVALQAQLVNVARRLVAALHWRDFEILVDRIFADSGWWRVGVLGGTQADVDLIIEQAATGERAFVQVKSRADSGVLDDYIRRFREYGGCDRMFFVCHSPNKALQKQHANPAPQVELWFSETVADKAVRAGLFDWLVDRLR